MVKDIERYDCSECYIEIKKWNPLLGLLLHCFLSLVLMIPIFNVFFVKWIRDIKEGDFWNGMWYNIEKKYIRRL